MTDEQLLKVKRTQAQRRSETRASLLHSACELFGDQGYEGTSLEEIAHACDLTIRPIYYHFGNKQGLYRAVNDRMEQKALEALSLLSATDAWHALLLLCRDHKFSRVIFVDAPNVLGRQRWQNVNKMPWARSLRNAPLDSESSRELVTVMSDRAALAALLEAANYVINHGEDKQIEQEAMQLIAALLPNETAGAA
jgi:AcrR family transcriptional regulator